MCAAFALAFSSQFIFSQTPGAAANAPGTADGANAAAVTGTAETAAAGPGTAASRAEEAALGFFNTPEPGTPGAASGVSAPSPVFAIFRMILVLALVAVFIYLAVYFLRRLGKPQAEQNPHLKVLASIHLGNGRYVHVVQAGRAAWLVGSGEGGVSHIADITDQEAVDAMALDASRKAVETPGFVPAFQALLHKFGGGLSGKEESRLEQMRRRREQFKRF